jgi:transcription antitermination factor NusG
MFSEVDSNTIRMGLTVREPCPGPSSEPCPDADRRQWFALTVKHQHERRVEGVLCASGVDTFLPLYRERRQWSDRVKDLDAPLFAGYLFGRFAWNDRARIANTPGVARIVGFAGLPAPVTEQEIEGVRAALASKLPLGPWPYLLKAGGRVRIERGPLRGIEGTLLREGSCLRLVLGVELLQRSLAVEVDPEMIGPIFN